MGAGELARAPMKSCFSVVQVVFITKGGSVKNRDAPVVVLLLTELRSFGTIRAKSFRVEGVLL